MEGSDIMLTIFLIGLGTLFWVGLMAVGCYCLHLRRKRLRSHRANLEEEEIILPVPKSQQQYYAMASHASSSSGFTRKLRNLGGIGFRSPLIRTRSVGAQLDAGVSATLPLLTSRPATATATASASTTSTPVNGRRGSDRLRTAGNLNIGARAVSTSNSSTNGGPSGNGNAVGNGAANSHSPGGSVLGAVGGPVSSLSPTSSPAPSSAMNKSIAGQKQEHPSMAFWQNRSISLVDMYIDNSEPTENVGQIHFSLEYDFQNTTLILKIMQGKDLPPMDMGGTSDPYVRVTLLPDKKHRLETKIKRRTLNPRWNETFYFEGFPIQKLQSRVLHLHVFDYDRFSRDDSIGEVFLPLCQVDFSEKPVFWKALKPPLKDKCGELLVSLCYHPTNSTLTLIALKARNLKAKDINGKSDPYVKVWLYFGEKRVEKRKTPVYKCTLEPVFNETFTFNVPWEKIRECSLDVRVMDFDNIGRNELIGRISLTGKNSTGASETKHWQDMITKPRQAVVQWHRLKPE
ncbi:synaptotagmin-7 isoform X1 [Daphnia magna]|uniref:synaptotagmin-7 isoform X1 n=1 Tax=Daphnia magna TaxID=35525 RepID=UPI001E1BB221|nr:synaptotagmin-7 isoform X1 [Daphnia magna]XP_045032725.1 synaptotagmin-7 isoform X1 [Daphnia magna]XP_045032726.1 synaptotagmin-7 isoform X1 [Daphnia magna]XP_045032727.1 synaptotagmin-7 isoform X1 [Daphnia magna]